MRIVISALAIEFWPETDHERDALRRIIGPGHRKLEIAPKAAPGDTRWPPDPKREGMEIRLPDPDDWGT